MAGPTDPCLDNELRINAAPWYLLVGQFVGPVKVDAAQALPWPGGDWWYGADGPHLSSYDARSDLIDMGDPRRGRVNRQDW